MDINITSMVARALCRATYEGRSEPLSKVRRADRVNDDGWWQSNPKIEQFSSSRHQAALQLYLLLAAHAQNLPTERFPASFEFRDGVQLRPDKGTIKAAIRSQRIIVIAGADLTFELSSH